jgi:hypothetical protein
LVISRFQLECAIFEIGQKAVLRVGNKVEEEFLNKVGEGLSDLKNRQLLFLITVLLKIGRVLSLPFYLLHQSLDRTTKHFESLLE